MCIEHLGVTRCVGVIAQRGEWRCREVKSMHFYKVSVVFLEAFETLEALKPGIILGRKELR